MKKSRPRHKQTGEEQSESKETTFTKLVHLSTVQEAQIAENDISNAHRMPFRNTRNQVVINGFKRRLKKFLLKRNEMNLIHQKELYESDEKFKHMDHKILTVRMNYTFMIC